MLHQIQEGYVKTETHKGITTIEFFHPQSNSLPAKILDELVKEFHVAGHDNDCKIIVLRSGGEKAFCAGASFNELSYIKNEADGLHFFSGFAHVINAMRRCSKIIVGRIQGKCVGGGIGLAAACDYAIAMEGADVKLSELSLGIGPFVVGPVIERKVGLAAFSQLALDAASWHSGEWARRKGLYAELHSTKDGLDESIDNLCSTLLHSNPEALTEFKRVLWQGTEHWDKLLIERAAISGRLVLSTHTKNYIEEFKRKLLQKK